MEISEHETKTHIKIQIENQINDNDFSISI